MKLHCLALALSLMAATALQAQPAPPPGYKISAEIRLPGPVRWDYLSLDPVGHRLYVAHGTQTEVIDTETLAAVGQLRGTHGVHGIAVAREFGRIFTSNGADNEIGVYDLESLRRIGTIKAGANPDAIVYEPASKRVIAFNGRSRDATIADAKTGTVLATVKLGGKPEYAVTDGHGMVYVHLEDKAEILTLDASSYKLVFRSSLAPCESPTGLDLDDRGRLYSVCGNGLMVITEAVSGRRLGQVPIGAGADGVAWVNGRAVSANGRDGTASVVKEGAPGTFELLATVPVALGARTIAAERSLDRLYLPTAEFRSAETGDEKKPGKAEAVPGSFRLIVMERAD